MEFLLICTDGGREKEIGREDAVDEYVVEARLYDSRFVCSSDRCDTEKPVPEL